MKFGDKIDFEKLDKAIVHDIILIGYPEDMPHNSGKITLDKIAEYNSESKEEEEKKRIERPFLEDGINSVRSDLAKEMKSQFLKMFTGKSPNYHKLAVMAITGIQDFVRGDYYKSTKPNSEITIMRKTSKKGIKKGEFKDKPLIDTGQTINGITYTIDRG